MRNEDDRCGNYGADLLRGHCHHRGHSGGGNGKGLEPRQEGGLYISTLKIIMAAVLAAMEIPALLYLVVEWRKACRDAKEKDKEGGN